jgi:hypothetical protein
VKEISKDNINRSMILFIVGTIIIVIAIIVITADIGFSIFDIYFTGYGAMLGFLAYLVGLVLVVLSIHSVRNFWGWLDFPLFFVVFYILNLFAPDLDEMPIPYRLLSISIFPLNYVAVLILFLVSINKAKVI